MLKPIHRLTCSPALEACQRLMLQFSLWLCDPATSGAHLTPQDLQPPVVGSKIEADWLWNFLQRVEARQSLLDRAQTLAAMPAAQKTALAAWVQIVSAVATQFQPSPVLWPVNSPLADVADWIAFKTLMEAFYEKGFRSGLPYRADGTPTAADGVTYAEYVSAFREAHRLNPNPHARQVCVLCGGPLGDTPHVDHWIIKSAFPLLSMCADNLQLICNTCNEAPNKGDKPVHSAGSFADWFHPYLRPGNGALQLEYVLPDLTVRCLAASPADKPKAVNLDALLNLSSRWTREFKAEYARHQDALRRRDLKRIADGQKKQTLQDLQLYVQHWVGDLSVAEPHYEVHVLLGNAMTHLARTRAWLSELATVT